MSGGLNIGVSPKIMNSLTNNLLKTKKGKKAFSYCGFIFSPFMNSLQFLADDYGFGKASIDMARRECWIELKRKDAKIIIEYELGSSIYCILTILNNGEAISHSLGEFAVGTSSGTERDIEWLNNSINILANTIRQNLLNPGIPKKEF
jgi:hypothetical protein